MLFFFFLHQEKQRACTLRMEDSTSSVHFHSECVAAPSCVLDESTPQLSLLSSLTITSGFNLWATTRSTGSNGTVEYSSLHSPSGRGTSSAQHNREQRLQQHVHGSIISDDDRGDVLWHRPPPPPPPALPSQHAKTADEGHATAAMNASNNEVQEDVEKRSPLQITTTGNGEVSSSSHPRRRTARTTLTSASSAKRRL